MSSENSQKSAGDDLVLPRLFSSAIRDGDTAKVKSLAEVHPHIIKLMAFGIGAGSSLQLAASEGKLELCEVLLSMGVDIDAYDKYGNTALCEACRRGHIDIAKLLVERDASIDGDPMTISTPLMNAITAGHDGLAKYLVKHGANINRLHTRLNQMPLDLAMVWGRSEVAEFLRSLGAVSTITETDWSKEYGGPIIQYVNNIAGKVLPIQLVKIVGELAVGQRIAIVNKGKNKLLFTVGLFALHKPMIELFIVLPDDWNMNDNSLSNQFPSMLLHSISNQVQQGLKIKEGTCIQSDDVAYQSLTWPDGLAGFCVSDHYWGRERKEEDDTPEDEKVHLLTLVPVKATKKGFPVQSIEKNRDAGWAKLTLK